MSGLQIKRVDWLLSGTVAGTIGIVLAVLVGFDILLALSEELGDLGTGDYTLVKALIHVGYTVPRRIHELFGSAALIGSLAGLGLLAGNGEITALRAAGMSKLRIALSATATVAALARGERAGRDVGAGRRALGATPGGAGQAPRLRPGPGSGLWARDGEAVINAKRAFVNAERELELREIRLYFFDGEGRLSRIVRSRAASSATMPGSWTMSASSPSTTTGSSPRSCRLAPGLRPDPEVLSLGAIRPRYLAWPTG